MFSCRDRRDPQNQNRAFRTRTAPVCSDGGSYEALGCVVHDAELEAALALEGLGERAAKRVRREDLLAAVLKLSKDVLKQTARSAAATRGRCARPSQPHLQGTEDARVLQTLVVAQLTETPAKDVQVPQNLEGQAHVRLKGFQDSRVQGFQGF